MKRIVIAFSYLLLCLGGAVFANDLRVTSIVVNQTAGTVTFDLSWKNSWRVTTQPANWDAAWVFVKFRQCGVDPNTPWDHGTLSFAGSTIPAALESVDGNTNTGVFYADNLGAMLRRSSTGVFPAAGNHNITLRVTNLPAAGTEIDVKVFGIEMVYIPQGNYFFGDNTGDCSRGNAITRQITSEAPTNPIGFTCNYPALGTGTNNVIAAASFPKGYSAFYIMKYEITQGQYRDFLNTLAANQQTSRYPGDCPAGCAAWQLCRYAMDDNGVAPNTYTTTRPDRAMTFISWADITAYLDWAALRPYSEMEFEKACRGPMAPIAYEYAWGSTNLVEGDIFSGAEDGTESFLNIPVPNCNWIDDAFIGGDGNNGPCRVGIFALPTSTGREQSGATYYGVMEMTGNVWEFVVPLSLNNCGATINFQRTLGDGYLTAAGDHNTANWPAPAPAIVGQNPHVIVKGGSWENTQAELRLSDRTSAVGGGHIARHRAVGGRGAR